MEERKPLSFDPERMRSFLLSMERELPPHLEKLYQEALAGDVPIIRPETAGILRVLLKMKTPDRILEIGTGTGFSALFMLDVCPARIVTIELDEKRAAKAEENFAEYDRDGRIRLIRGDAADILPDLEESFSFIFLDAAKGQYVRFLPEIMRLLKPGGVLASDNVLQEGSILESHYAVERRDRTIYRRMREYLWAITHDDSLMTTILPAGDGLAVSVKL